MFDQAISHLKNIDMIGNDDIVIACMDNVTKATILGGAIGAAIASSRAGRYILAANKEYLSIFDVDKKTGEFLGTCTKIGSNEIKGAKVKGGLGSFSVKLRTDSWKGTYATSNKFQGRHQKDDIAKLKELFESDFTDEENE